VELGSQQGYAYYNYGIHYRAHCARQAHHSTCRMRTNGAGVVMSESEYGRGMRARSVDVIMKQSMRLLI
jgi:hypothetical protein